MYAEYMPPISDREGEEPEPEDPENAAPAAEPIGWMTEEECPF